MSTLDTTPSAVLASMAFRAQRIADALGNDGQSYATLADECRAELARRLSFDAAPAREAA